MIRKLMAALVGNYCKDCDTYYRTDLCPRCNKVRFYRHETTDRRPEWTRADGKWPEKKRGDEPDNTDTT